MILSVGPEGALGWVLAVPTLAALAAYALAAQWVVIGLFAILVVLLGVNVVRRRRTKAAGGAS